MRFLSTILFVLFAPLLATEDAADYLKRKCLKNADANAWTELEHTIKNLPNSLSNLATIDCKHDLYNLICHDLRDEGYTCLENLMEKLQPCLDSESGFLPHFALNTFNYSIDQQCQDGAAKLFNEMHDVDNMTCNTPTSAVVENALHNCLPRFLQLDNPDHVLTESYFCCEIQNVQSCILDVVTEACGNDLFSSYLSQFMDVGLMWCEKLDLDLSDINAADRVAFATDLYIKMKCLRNGGANAVTELSKVITEEFPQSDKLTDMGSPEAIYVVVCTEIPKLFSPFLEKVMKKLDRCLDVETKFLSDFIFTTFSSTIEALCNDEENVFEDRLYKAWNASCEVSDAINIQMQLFETCVPKMPIFNNTNECDYSMDFTESIFCNTLELTVDCIVETLEEHCDNNEIPSYMNSVLQSALIWCNSTTTIINDIN